MSARTRSRTLTLCVALLSSGCGEEGTPVDPDSTTRSVTIAAGNLQEAGVGRAVPVPPAVRVRDGDGAPVSGAGVSFAVTGGGGSVTGATVSTGSDGVAAVGTWVLGVAGANTLEATVAGATSGSPALFVATGLEIVMGMGRSTFDPDTARARGLITGYEEGEAGVQVVEPTASWQGSPCSIRPPPTCCSC